MNSVNFFTSQLRLLGVGVGLAAITGGGLLFDSRLRLKEEYSKNESLTKENFELKTSIRKLQQDVKLLQTEKDEYIRENQTLNSLLNKNKNKNCDTKLCAQALLEVMEYKLNKLKTKLSISK